MKKKMKKCNDKVLRDEFGIPFAIAHYIPACIFLGTQLYKITYEMIKRSYPNRYRKKTFQKYNRKCYYILKRRRIVENTKANFTAESFKSSIENFKGISIKKISKDEV